MSHEEIAPYLTMEIALSRMRIIAQARLSCQPLLWFVSDGSALPVDKFQQQAQDPIYTDEAISQHSKV